MSRSLEDTPTLPKILFFETSEGKKVKILEEIGARYRDFGMLLLDDQWGAITEYIALAKQNNVAEINREILSRWVEGEGKQPVTWATLIGVLKAIGRSGLAQIFKNNLK